uniref:NADH dehydrogenase subunit 2 n=1 Tax=Comanthus parvicirrus TaxID=1529418 RepID=UPI001EE102FB|nr:NADH dehydrogenase subunit 2 [Comanthus parvicirrus]UFQ22704.1 NADH dehydrogenase subunit 2 [Comanthus parvicirrus]UHY39300.1 NADH dehydrogenase subunit 2 [Comanthus parvicirrus]
MNRINTSFFLINIVIGTILVILSNHWFLIWIGLEINTMSIIPIILSIQNRRNVEASIKYFIIQAIAATILLNAALINIWNNGSWLINNPLNIFSSNIVTISLLLKLSISPFHFWYPEVINGLSLINGLIITTWQKIAPTILIFSIINNLNIFIITICTISSIILGAWSGLNQTQTRKILAFSSINHIGWIILISIYNPNISLLMFFIYIIINIAIFSSLINNNTINIANANKNNIINPWNASLFSLTILSLGGLPPLTGFTNKILAFNTLIANSIILSNIPLILSSLISLFFYLRIAFNTNMTNFPQNSIFLINTRNNSNININSSLFLFSIIGIVILPFLINIIS